MQTCTGIIVRIIRKKKYGFIRPDGSETELFFHLAGLIEPRDFDSLREGQPVSYFIVDGKDGRGQRAIGVVVN